MVVRLDKRRQFLAVSLTTLSGYVDGIGFVALGGMFVSFMSGNSTRLAVGIAEGSSVAGTALALIASFTLGVFLGTLLGNRFPQRRKFAVLFLVAAALLTSALLDYFGLPRVAPMFLALAMGVVNCVFQRGGDVAIGLTYMTGALVKIGTGVATAVSGGDRWGWLPWLRLWLGLVVGAVLGAHSYQMIGISSLWFAIVTTLIFAKIAWPLDVIGPQE